MHGEQQEEWEREFPQTPSKPGEEEVRKPARTWALQCESPSLKAVARFQGRANNKPREPDIRPLCSQRQKFLFLRAHRCLGR